MAAGKGNVISEELELFSDDPLQGQMEERTTETILPLSTEYSNTITFEVKNNREGCYLDPANIRLEVEVGIKKHDGTNWVNMAKGDKLFPINNLLHSMFKDVECQVNNQVINQNNSCYPYLSYIVTLLSYSDDYLDTQGFTFGWEKDEAKKFDTVDVADDSPRQARHMTFINGSDVYHTRTLIGRFVGELFQQERLMVHGADLRLVLRRTGHDFVLMGESANKQQLVILKALLHVDFVKIDDTLLIKHYNMHQKKNMIIPITRKLIKTYNITKGTYSETISSLFNQGILPKRMVLAMTTNQAFNGIYNKNCFNFQHFGLTELRVNYGGKDFPNKPFKPDFANQDYTKSYMSLFQGTDKLDKDVHLPITYEEYPEGFTVFCFDFTPDISSSDNVKQLQKTGNITIDLRFSSALTQTVTLIAYAEYDNKIEIDFAKNVYKDY